MTGSPVGNYHIEVQLGSGGMATVYRAVDTRLGRIVALKFLHEELTARRDSRERFRREARDISSLNHPNICTLYDIGESDGKPYLVMEYVEGVTIADRLGAKAFTVPELVHLGTQVADALDAGTFSRHHSSRHQTVEHLCYPSGQAKVLDFGILRLVSSTQ